MIFIQMFDVCDMWYSFCSIC